MTRVQTMKVKLDQITKGFCCCCCVKGMEKENYSNQSSSNIGIFRFVKLPFYPLFTKV